jgi:hypothetical protein
MKKPIERVEVIMERLGFNENSSDGVKAAFVKNLIKQAYGIEVPVPSKYVEPTLDDFLQIRNEPGSTVFLSDTLTVKKVEAVQLSFDLGESPKAG